MNAPNITLYFKKELFSRKIINKRGKYWSRDAKTPPKRRTAHRETRKPHRNVGQPIARRENPTEASDNPSQDAKTPPKRRRSLRGSRLPFWQSGEPFASRNYQNGASESLSRAAKTQTELRRTFREPRLPFWQSDEPSARRDRVGHPQNARETCKLIK